MSSTHPKQGNDERNWGSSLSLILFSEALLHSHIFFWTIGPVYFRPNPRGRTCSSSEYLGITFCDFIYDVFISYQVEHLMR